MKTILKRITGILIALFITPTIFCYTSIENSLKTSIEWQRIELVKNIKSQYVQLISPVIKSGEYIIDVDVALKGEQPEEFVIDVDPNANAKKKKVHFSEVNSAEAKADYIAFSKLGLEAPEYDEDELDLKGEVESWFKAVTKLNQNYDIFNSIVSVKASISFSNLLSEETKKVVQQLITNSTIRFGKIVPSTSVLFIDMKESRITDSENSKNEEKKERLKLLGGLGTAMGLILTALILGVLAYVIFRRYADLQREVMSLMKNSTTNKEKESEKKKDKEKDENKELAAAILFLAFSI